VKAGSVVACEKPPANLWRKLADFTPLRKANYDQVTLSCAAVIGIATPLIGWDDVRAPAIETRSDIDRHYRRIVPFDDVAESDLTTLHHASRDPAVTSHGVVTAGAECLFHVAARRAVAGPVEDRFADAKATLLQGEEVDPAGDEIAAKNLRRDVGFLQERRNRCQVLSSDQRDLPRSAPTARISKVVDLSNPDAGIVDLTVAFNARNESVDMIKSVLFEAANILVMKRDTQKGAASHQRVDAQE
jgi:hypothetical protein